MCVLCGALASNFHWSVIKNDKNNCEVAGFTKDLTRSRYLKIAILKTILSPLEINAWQGESFILANKTGNTLIVDDLASIWKSASKLGLEIDPLDDEFMAKW